MYRNIFQNCWASSILLFIVLSVFIFPPFALASLIPNNDSSFYYKIGGGENIPIPAYNGAQSIPLRVEGDVGLGYNCGVFNPKLSIVNSLNNIKNSYQNIERSVLNNATAAITELPMYAIARSDSPFYDVLNNNFFSAFKNIELSTKSCQMMQSEIAKGQNPYAEWASVSMGNDWKYHMSLANGTPSLKATGNAASGDINQVKQQVEQDNGTNGVPWVHGSNIGRSGKYAGGQNQPAIYVIRDTVIAGYNVILQSGRDYDDTSVPSKNEANSHLVEAWNSPSQAASWITNVLGDAKITTYPGGDKQSSPGVGLLPDNQTQTQKETENLQKLVSGQQSITLESLKAVSAPGVMINTAVIQAIRQKAPVTQAIVITKLAQEIATAKLIDKALLARQILQEGSQVPAIYGNKAAQETIKNSMNHLDKAIDNLLFNVRVRKELVSETAAQLLNTTQAQQINSTTIQGSGETAPLMNQGAIKTDKNHSS